MEDFDTACRLVAQQVNRKEGVWAYEAFDYINAAFFAGALPTPLILWMLTPYGRCLGLTQSSKNAPVIALHPTMIYAGPSANPWGVSRQYLGVRYVFDVLIHECMHVNINYLMGGRTGESSHNCPEWVREVNRIAPCIGLEGVEADVKKVKRVPIEGKTTKTGKPATKTARVEAGNITLRELSTFPYSLRYKFNQMDYYRAETLPFPNALCECNENHTWK